MGNAASATARSEMGIEHAASAAAGSRVEGRYTAIVGRLFTFFGATRLLTYLPTIWAIYASADSSQYSLLTWITWVGANASMAAWLYEGAGRRLNRAIVVTIGNSVMCLATCLMICAFR